MQKRLRTVLWTSGSRRERALECELGDPVSRPVTWDKSLQLSECFSSYVKGRVRNRNSEKHVPQPLLEIELHWLIQVKTKVSITGTWLSSAAP